MKVQHWQSRHFRKIFKTVYISSFALLLLALVILYSAFQHISISYTNTVMARFMDGAYSNVDRAMNSSQKMCLQTHSSRSGSYLLSSRSDNVSSEFWAMKDIDYLISQNPNIHSMLLYNAKTGKIYMFGADLTKGNIGSFYDREIASEITGNDIQVHSFRPREIPFSPYNPQTVRVLTSVYNIGNGNAIVVNLNVDELFSILSTESLFHEDDISNYLVLYGHEGQIYHGYSDSNLDSLESEIMDILAAHNWESSFNASISGIPYHFQITEDPARNLQMISFVEHRDISANFSTYMVVFLCIVLITGLMAAFVNWIISSKLYSPIDRIRSTLSEGESEGKTPAVYEDEIDEINHRITERTSEIKSLFTYKQQSKSISQESFLKSQLLQGKYTDEEFWERCKTEELPYHKGDSFLLIYAQWVPKQPKLEDTVTDQGLLCFALGNVMHELLDMNASIKDIPFDQNGIAFLFTFSQGAVPTVKNTVLTKVQETFDQFFNLSLSFFISSPFRNPHAMLPSMQSLQELSGYKFFCPDGCILYSDTFNTDDLITEICPTPDITKIEAQIRSCNFEECSNMVATYFKSLNRCTWEAAEASINVFLSKLLPMFKRIATTCPAFPSLNYYSFYDQVISAYTLKSAESLIQNYLKEVTLALEAAEPSNSGLNAKSIQEYIEHNFSDYDLSSKSIAEHFHVSVAYLNRIFKQKTGESISSYIKLLRLQKAKDMLLDTNKPIESIAKSVGFENTKYFYPLFKNEYGISPNNFRTMGKEIDS